MRVLLFILILFYNTKLGAQNYVYMIEYPNDAVDEMVNFNGCLSIQEQEGELCGFLTYNNNKEVLIIVINKKLYIISYRYINYFYRKNQKNQINNNYFLLYSDGQKTNAYRVITYGEINLFREEIFEKVYLNSIALYKISYQYYFSIGRNKNLKKLESFKKNLLPYMKIKSPEIQKKIEKSGLNVEEIAEHQMVNLVGKFNQKNIN